MDLKPPECKAPQSPPLALIHHPFSTTLRHGEKTATILAAMNPLAGFHRRRGTPFWQTPNALWLPAGSFSIYAAPSSLPTSVDRCEMESALRASGRLVALATCTHPTGLAPHAFILRDKNYGPHSLQRQFRQQVKKATQHCGVEPIDWPKLSRLGLPVNRSLLARGRERRSRIATEAHWRRFCEAAQSTPGLEAHGVFGAGELLAYIVILEWNGFCHGLHMHWSGARPEWHPTHLLYFDTARALITRPEVEAFGIGRQTLPANPSLDRFKAHAGFAPEKIHLAVAAHPRWRPVLEKIPGFVPNAVRRHIPVLRNLEAIKSSPKFP
jgi:hypothetical protein